MEAGPVRTRVASATWLSVITAAWIVLYFRLLFLGKMFILRDQLIHTWTERKALADELLAARVPQWNDLVAFGRQFAASDGVTYFPLWLVALLPLPLSMDLVTALHVLFAGAGVALFSRRLGANVLGTALAAVAFMACGYVATFAPYGTFTGTAWLPWVAWAADLVARPNERQAVSPSHSANPARGQTLRAATILAAVVAAQMLAGDPASSITTGLVAFIVVLARAGRLRKSLVWIAGAYVAALILAAVAVLPGLALLPYTSRSTLSFSAATVWSLHPWRLLELVWPRVLGNPSDPSTNLAELVANSGAGELGPSLSLSLYLGAPILALAIIAAKGDVKGSRAMLAGAVVLILLALGAYTPIYSAFRFAFLPERIIRYPEKHVAGAICLVCALAGAGVAELSRANRAVKWSFVATLACIALPLAALLLLRPWIIQRLSGAAALMSPPLELQPTFARSIQSGIVSLAVAVCVSWLLLRSTHARIWKLAGPFALILYLVHAVWEGWAVTPVAPAERFARMPSLLRGPASSLEQPAPPPRLLRSPVFDAEVPSDAWPEVWHETLYLDSPGRFGFAAVPGFNAWRSPEFDAFWTRAGRMPLDAFLTLFAIDFVAIPKEVRQRLFPDDGGRPMGSLAELELGYAGSDADGKATWTLVRTFGVRPRAFVAPRWRWIPPAAALDTLLDPARPPDPGQVLLSGEGQGDGNASGKLTPCTFTAYHPEDITMVCEHPSGGYAVIADEYAPGWTATVDGKPAAIARADLMFRAVRIAPGSHRVEFTYHAPFLAAGAIISAVAWLAWLALLQRVRPLVAS